MSYQLHFRYVYEFYSFGEVLTSDVRSEIFPVTPSGRFTLDQQEDGSFQTSDLSEDAEGKFTVLTYPNKDRSVVHLGRECPFSYDEYYSVMGDDNHNVYECTVTLEEC